MYVVHSHRCFSCTLLDKPFQCFYAYFYSTIVSSISVGVKEGFAASGSGGSVRSGYGAGTEWVQSGYGAGMVQWVWSGYRAGMVQAWCGYRAGTHIITIIQLNYEIL